MSTAIILSVVRRTITLPDQLDARVRAAADEDESFSAAVTRLIDRGLAGTGNRPSWIGSGESDDPELAFRVEDILAELARSADPND
jgi:hypothetical protein